MWKEINMITSVMDYLFNKLDESILEKFEILFKNSTTNKEALNGALKLIDQCQSNGIIFDLDEIIEVAESYDFDISDIETILVD